MSSRDNHPPCPCGAELADECMRRPPCPYTPASPAVTAAEDER
jgi:hypothetical protein